VAIRALREREREDVLDLLEQAFGERALFAAYMDHDPGYRPEDFLVDVEDGRMRSCVQLFEKRIRLRGRQVRLGGIGSVATAPADRRKGLAGELMRRQTQAMRERGMAVGLLFAGPVPFYEALGWHALPLRSVALAADGRTNVGRPLRSADLPAVRALYDAFNCELDGATIRDAAYWTGQLRYAGSPDEDFCVVERAGRLVAYARVIELSGVRMLMEYAHAEDARAELAHLIASRAPTRGAMIARLAPDPALDAALAAAGLASTELADRSTMWRVLDTPTLAALAGLPKDSDHGEILSALFGDQRAHYWYSDRF